MDFDLPPLDSLLDLPSLVETLPRADLPVESCVVECSYLVDCEDGRPPRLMRYAGTSRHAQTKTLFYFFADAEGNRTRLVAGDHVLVSQVEQIQAPLPAGIPDTPEVRIRLQEYVDGVLSMPSALDAVVRRAQEKRVAAYSESPSDNVHVCTPERELQLVRAFAPIGLDPASNHAATVGARVEWFGPAPRCAICGAAASCGLSPAAADRCGAHAANALGDDNRPRVVQFSPETLARYGEDGLTASWVGVLAPGEIAFLQPPYGKHIIPWIPKANTEAMAGAEIIGLLPGRFDTRWFAAMHADRICWYGRRAAYVDHAKPDQKDSAKFPSVFAYWGGRPARFGEIFGAHGVVTGWRGRAEDS